MLLPHGKKIAGSCPGLTGQILRFFSCSCVATLVSSHSPKTCIFRSTEDYKLPLGVSVHGVQDVFRPLGHLG